MRENSGKAKGRWKLLGVGRAAVWDEVKLARFRFIFGETDKESIRELCLPRREATGSRGGWGGRLFIRIYAGRGVPAMI